MRHSGVILPKPFNEGEIREAGMGKHAWVSHWDAGGYVGEQMSLFETPGQSRGLVCAGKPHREPGGEDESSPAQQRAEGRLVPMHIREP